MADSKLFRRCRDFQKKDKISETGRREFWETDFRLCLRGFTTRFLLGLRIDKRGQPSKLWPFLPFRACGLFIQLPLSSRNNHVLSPLYNSSIKIASSSLRNPIVGAHPILERETLVMQMTLRLGERIFWENVAYDEINQKSTICLI